MCLLHQSYPYRVSLFRFLRKSTRSLALLRSLQILTHVSPRLGGAYDTVPELCILLSLFEASDKHYPIVFDEAGQSPSSSTRSSILNLPTQATASQHSTYSQHLKITSPQIIFCSIAQPTRSSRVTLSSVSPLASNSLPGASDTCGPSSMVSRLLTAIRPSSALVQMAPSRKVTTPRRLDWRLHKT